MNHRKELLLLMSQEAHSPLDRSVPLKSIDFDHSTFKN